MPEIYDQPNDSKVVQNIASIVAVDADCSIASANKYYDFYATTSSYGQTHDTVIDNGLPKEVEYRLVKLYIYSEIVLFIYLLCSSIELDTNTNIVSCSETLSVEDYTKKMQFNITEKKTCEYQKYGIYSEKLCESMYYDYSPLRNDYPELQIDITDLNNVNTQDFNNMLDEEMAKDVNIGKF